jgi:protein phosphatase 2C-like protein
MYAYASPPGNLAGGAGGDQLAGEVTVPAGSGDEAGASTAPEPMQDEPPPPVPAVPGGTIVGYGQRVEPAAWTTKEKKQDGFPPVGDFDQVALSARGWAVVGSSRIGRGHLQDGKFREDAIAAEIVDGKWHLAAVADGGGSYKLARLGARVAAAAAVRRMRQAIYQPQGADDNEKVRHVVETGLRAAYQAIYGEAERLQTEEERKQAGVGGSVKDLRTTLLLVVHHELEAGRGHLVGGGQVGDGAVVARIVEGGKTRLVWLSEPDTGPQGNETVFLTDLPNTDEDWARRVSFQHLYGDVVYCLAMTDGVSDDFVPLEDNLERLEKPMFQVALGEKDLAMAAQKLEQLLGYERQGSFDDRSLVCICKQGVTPWK